MPFNYSRTIPNYDKEIMKYAVPVGTPVRSVVLDANKFQSGVTASTPDARTVVPAGTILTYSGSTAFSPGAADRTKVMRYQGVGEIVGILGKPIDLLTQATAGMEPAAAYYRLVSFATTQIVDFTTYSAQLVAAMPTCSWE